jgi:ribosomal protein S18 acetylase RimI-like enzyme
VVRLTEAGRAERADSGRRSDDLARSLLAPLDERQQTRLIEAMATVERLLTAGLVEIAVEDPAGAAAQSCLRTYFAEINARFDSGFDPEQSISAGAAELVEPAGLLLVARLAGEPVGCGAVKFDPGGSVQIKRMWVAGHTRGLGLGRRLLRELEEQARRRGAVVARLETNRNLSEAIKLYRSCGYREVPAFNDEPYAHHWFEKDLSES